MSLALLMTLTQPHPQHEEEFNAWYDDEHMAERLSIPGFISARRWVSRAVPGQYLATYEIESLAVFESAAYLAHYGDNQSPWSKRNLGRLKVFQRWVAEQITPGNALPAEGNALFLSARDCPPALDGDFNRWYDEEHLVMLGKIDGMLRARRFRSTSGEPKYLALYDLTKAELQQTPAWKAAGQTEWAKRITAALEGSNRMSGLYDAYPKMFTRDGPRSL